VLGDTVELCHDTHERLAPSMTVQLAKALEPYRLFFLEDSLPPEQVCLCSNHMHFVQMIERDSSPSRVASGWRQNEHFRIIRQHSTVPIAMGELFVNVQE
jgi:mannonate dehydratase